uniref:Short-chain dehydrogenase/reductase SDR n=1 Tax=Caulobacter sp. (strain K31) TaxID=366602 RepID=B0T982_CAUSK
MAANLTGKTALIAHGAAGLGAHVAFGLAALGANVAVSHAGQTSAAALLERRIAALGARLHVFEIDTARPGYADRLVAEVQETQGGLDIVVADATVLATPSHPQGVVPLRPADTSAAVSIARAAAPALARRGRLILVGSLLHDTEAAGASAMPALDRLARELAKAVASRDATVNLVAAGPMDVDLTEGLRADAHAALAHQCFPRLGRVEEIVAPILFLATPAASYITGATLRADGGRL